MDKSEITFYTTQINEAIAGLSNESNAKQMAAYMKGHFEYYGVKTPARKDATKGLIRESKSMSLDDVIRVIHQLWILPHREMQMVAVDIGIYHRKKWTEDYLAFWLDLIKQKSWWDTVDMIASNVIGSIMTKLPPDHRKSYAQTWIKNDNMWIRRVALIYQLKYKDDTDADLLFDLIEQVQHDKEFFISKAVGWSLRQYSKHDSESVSSFVEEHRETLQPLSVREASKYL